MILRMLASVNAGSSVTSIVRWLVRRPAANTRIAPFPAATLQGVTDTGVTVSVGVACYPDNGADQEELFTVVDGLLYKAKELGIQILSEQDILNGDFKQKPGMIR